MDRLYHFESREVLSLFDKLKNPKQSFENLEGEVSHKQYDPESIRYQISELNFNTTQIVDTLNYLEFHDKAEEVFSQNTTQDKNLSGSKLLDLIEIEKVEASRSNEHDFMYGCYDFQSDLLDCDFNSPGDSPF